MLVVSSKGAEPCLYNTKIIGNNSGHASCLKHIEDYNLVYFHFHRECMLILNLIAGKAFLLGSLDCGLKERK